MSRLSIKNHLKHYNPYHILIIGYDYENNHSICSTGARTRASTGDSNKKTLGSLNRTGSTKNSLCNAIERQLTSSIRNKQTSTEE